jgi:hypothetical protein
MNMRHFLGFLFLAGSALAPLHAAPAADQKGEKKGKPDYKVTIFDDEHLKGKSVVIRQSVPNLSELKFSDKSESISWSLAPGKAAVVCDDKEFQRPVLLLVGEGSVEDLGKEQRNALHSISSVAIVPCAKGKYPKGISKDVPRLGSEE